MADILKINGKSYGIPTSLRLGETRMIKRITGLTPPEFNKQAALLSKTQDPDILTALVWWIMHREDPSFTLEDIEALEMGDIGGGEDGNDDPKDSNSLSETGSINSASSGNSATTSSPSSETPSTTEINGNTSHVSGGAQDLALSGQST